MVGLSIIPGISFGKNKEEYLLRKEISELMKSTGTKVGYFTGSGTLCVKQSLNSKNIIDGYKDISMRNLYRIREELNWNINKGFPEISMHE